MSELTPGVVVVRTKKPPGFAAGGFLAQHPEALLETN
jgi:hypothetical protein